MKPKKPSANKTIDKALRDFSRAPKNLPPPKKPQQRIKGWDSGRWDSESQISTT